MAKKRKAGAKASKRKAQAVAKPAALDLAVLASDSKDASGFGNLDLSRDIAIPYINILQSNSPQLNPIKSGSMLKEQRWDSSTILVSQEVSVYN